MTTRITVVSAVLCIATVTQAAESTKGGGKKAKAAKMVVVTPADAKWMDLPVPRGAQVATIRGNFGKGAHATLVKFPGGTDNPLHVHKNTLRSVIISGTWYQGDDQSSARDLGPGTYFETPGGWKHVSGCRAGADCLFYEESNGKFDFQPVDPAKSARADVRDVPAPHMGWEVLQAKP